MAKRKGKHMFNACDTCGAIGFLKELVICRRCKNTFRHSYCMADMYSDFAMRWHCDDCRHSHNVDQEQKEITIDNKDSNAEDNNRMETLLQLGNEDQVMENKLTRKVLVNSAKNDKQSDTGVSGSTRPTNKKVANALTYSASLSKDPGAALPQKMAPLQNPKYSKENLVNCHDQPCWKGTFEILDGNFHLPPYQGLRAHLSCDVNPKVVDLCKSLSEKIEFKEFPLSKVWPKIFMLEPPNTDDVALYFFCDTGRPREKYIRLVQRLDSRDHALKAKMKGAQLLLFSSKKLPPNSQKTKHMSYLWGIVRFPKPRGILKNTTVKSTNSTPKTKKTIRFDLSNLPPADININAKKNLSNRPPAEKEADGVFVRVDTKCDKVKDKVYYHTNEVDPDLPPGFSNFVPSKQQTNVQLQTDSEKGNSLKNKDVINMVTNISFDPDIPPGFSYPSSALRKSSLTSTSDNLTYQDVQLRMDRDNGKIVKNNGIINKLTNVCVDPDIPPGFSYPSSAFVKSSLANTANNHTDQDVPGFSYLPTNDVRIETSFPLHSKPKEVISIENASIQMENSDMSIDSEDEIEESSMPNVDMSFNNSAIKKDLLIPDIGAPSGLLTKNDVCIETSFSLHSKSKEVDMSIENVTMTTENIAESIENEGGKGENIDVPIEAEDENTLNVPIPFNSSSIKKDLLIPNIGPPPGFPEIPVKLAKCIVGTEMNNCFIPNIGPPPGFSDIAVKHHFVLPIECCECLQGVKNGTCAVKSIVKADKVNIKREACLEDINFVKPNFVQSPLSKDATSTMIKCQNAPIVCAKAPDRENKSGESPNNQSPRSSANKENNFISPNSAEGCNKLKFTPKDGCKSYENNLSWMNKTMRVAVPNDAENGTFRSNVKAQSENSGKTLGKNTFGVKFSLKKTDKPGAPVVPICFENASNVDSQITPKPFQKTNVSESFEDGSFWHTKGNCATRDKQASEEKSSSRSSRSLTEPCLKNHYTSKNPVLTFSASSAEKARDVSSRTVNLESISEVKRILLEVKKSRELKGKE